VVWSKNTRPTPISRGEKKQTPEKASQQQETSKSNQIKKQAAKRTYPHKRENLTWKEKSLGTGYQRPQAGLGKHARKALAATNKNQSREKLSPDAYRKQITAQKSAEQKYRVDRRENQQSRKLFVHKRNPGNSPFII
jgi:hypothetical protein